MKKYFFAILLLIIYSCQSTKIKNETFKVSPTTPELGSIGQSKSEFGIQNDFWVRTVPRLDNDIRLTIEVVPFNRKLNKFYKKKAKYNQSQLEIEYIDSLPKKPELVTIRILDVTGFINELNADYNSTSFRLLSDTQNSEIISSIVVRLNSAETEKIKDADTYYLTNIQDKRYAISLYKLGKKTETIVIIPTTIVAYRSSFLCWAKSDRGKWYLADMTEEKNGCRGNTKSKIDSEKKSKNLFDM